MSTKDRASNRAQDPKGRVTKAVGRITTSNRDLQNKSTTEQVKAGMNAAVENLEDAVDTQSRTPSPRDGCTTVPL
jgi:uncharacterized protein YjbJ (UPF0337 family)